MFGTLFEAVQICDPIIQSRREIKGVLKSPLSVSFHFCFCLAPSLLLLAVIIILILRTPITSYLLLFRRANLFGQSKTRREYRCDMFPELLEDTLLLVFDVEHDMELVKDVFNFSQKFSFWVDIKQSFCLVFAIIDAILVLVDLRNFTCSAPKMLVEGRLPIRLKFVSRGYFLA
jgi:hypothetical protein